MDNRNIDELKTEEEIDQEIDNLEIPDDEEDKDPEKKNLQEDEDSEELADDENPEEEEPDDDEEEDVEDPKKTPEKKAPGKDDVDYREKLAASTREALTQQAKNRKLNESIEAAASITDLTEEELSAELARDGIDYSKLDATQKLLAKKAVLADKRFGKVYEAAQEGKEIDKWAGKVDEFIETPTTLQSYPQLTGREAEFRSFCMKQSRRGADLEDLVRAFSFDVKPEPKKKGALLLSGSSPTKAPSKQELSADDLRVIRSKDPKRYRQLVMSGKADNLDF